MICKSAVGCVVRLRWGEVGCKGRGGGGCGRPPREVLTPGKVSGGGSVGSCQAVPVDRNCGPLGHWSVPDRSCQVNVARANDTTVRGGGREMSMIKKPALANG